ncbi:MAG: cysteine--tRNA ligase [Candidatus Doudnabacteria bacterium RIFCSPHIGHO2_01_FULL_50_11]|uniref:Cysteine--tRNA ligase n=1 Tax=Candidatus Doudnabacteria bacterium RIFCSPHIGHO2_01_FULL_50_11 TaxID=1817828 RepID=A0A1F5PHU4_9BACT|nr:MAG: cysteine--tRNA ligase [Candidatus Doudnabacteria bacterium RIFCSPHIGHO2_01_FULL_50_11]HLC44812.1 cysteine--tRNA ligase [Patescibacteria group bacterium]
MSGLKLYNTLSRKIETFTSIAKGRAGLYTCGPTVYNFAHIGNLRTYIFEDVLRRVLEYDGYQVTHAMNITDVGHLVSDADEGEDKMEVGAKREGKLPLEIAKKYETAFFEDLKSLNVELPHKVLRATDAIKEQIEIIKTLEQKRFTYKDGYAIYFDTSKLPDYGKLSGQKLSDKKTGARSGVIVDTKKRNPADFALWFFLAGRYKNHILHWPSPWGEGFPGWHIECSAISRKLLGQPFDIHTGGVDHIGTHHTNEIAQSESALGKPLANFWLHGEFLLLKEGKMAKSGGSFITLKTVLDKGFSPLAYRYLCLSAHWRSKLNFSWESLDAAQNALDNLYEKISELEGSPSIAMCDDYARAFDREINRDLDMPRALSLTWRLMKKPNPDKLKLSTIKHFDRVLGLDLLKGAAERKKIPAEIKELAARRDEARAKKDFASSDRIRKEIESEGFQVRDTEDGTLIRKK